MIEYIHKVSGRSRAMKISINAKGEVIVTTPRFIPQFIINRFVHSHQDWIEHHQQKLSKVKNSLSLKDNQVLLFGKVYDLVSKLDHKVPVGVKRVGDRLHVNPVSQTKASIQKTLDRFLKTTGSTYILRQVETLGKKMNTTFNHVSFKTQKTRWGSCSSQGNLNFNWRLVHTPPEVINYVIVHELAHRTHMNHSAQFWALVAKFDPEYQRHRNWLKKHGMSLHD